jgi:hypothetical protein
MSWIIRGSITGKTKRFSHLKNIQVSFNAHPASYTKGTRFLPPWVKQLGHKIDPSPASSTKVKNEWNYTSYLD